MNGRSQSLYRKYRPTTFAEDDLVGQEHVSRTLRNAVRHDRVAHAYLFCGPRGSGKTSSARLLAKAVNCEDADPAKRPCNRCDSCRAINEGRATDIIEIDAASNRGIEDIRDLREKVKFSPSQLRKKFYIIDEVHQLTREASNALLKTLEEPPPHAIFILATTDPEKVLDTISSRCQTFIFHRIPTERIVEHLRRVADKEGIKASDEALALIARSATGAMRDALGLLDQLSAYGASEEGITADTVRQLLGAGDTSHVVALVDAIAAGETGDGLRVINAVVDGGADVRRFATQIVEYLRALLHAAASTGRGGQPAATETVVAPAHLEAFTLGEIAALVKRFSQVDYGLRHSSHGHLPLELCLVDCILARGGAETTSPRPAPAPPRALPSRPIAPVAAAPRAAPIAPEPVTAALPERTPTPIRPEPVAPTPAPAIAPDPAPQATRTADDDWAASLVSDEPAPTPEAVAPAPAVPPAPAPAQPSISLDEVRDRWSRIRQTVRASSRQIEALLASADPFQIDDETLTLAAPYDFHRDRINKDDARKVIEEVVAQILGRPYHVRCVNQEEARSLGPAPASVAPTPPPPSPPGAAAPAPPPMPAPTMSAPTPSPVADDPPPWSDPEPVPTPAVQPGHATEVTPVPAPTRPQAHHIRETAASPARAGVDERYISALRNLFNAEEIRVEGGQLPRLR
jgi:DNA polymerase-3 subunit gamma/tau